MKPIGHNRLFVEGTNIGSGIFKITGDELHHLKVKRMKEDEVIIGLDGKGLELTGRIISLTRSEVACEIITEKRHDPPEKKIVLGIGIIKSNRMVYACEKAAELGAWEIVPIRCENSVKDISNSEIERLNRVTLSAMKQSGRFYKTKVQASCDLKLFLKNYFEKSVIYYLDYEGSSIFEIPGKTDISLLTGPEGGFTDVEIEDIRKKGGKCISLGNYRLRSETVAALAVGCLNLKK